MSGWLQQYRQSRQAHQSLEWDFGSGRIENRRCCECPLEESLKGLLESTQSWKGLNALIVVEAEREKNGQKQLEQRYYLSSLKEVAAQHVNTLVRQHWDIENGLHWQLDVTFQEDRCRIREAKTAENMATLRKMTLQAL